MKSNKKIFLIGVAVLLLAGHIGCGKKNAKESRRDEKRAIENFGNFILAHANDEVVNGMSKTAVFDEYAGYDDKKLQAWIDLYVGDSTLYANALKRDAWMIYDANEDPEKSLEKIHNAPIYSRGPGTDIDANGNAKYNPNSIKGINQLHNMEVNYNNYKDRIRSLYKMRNEMSSRCHKK